MRILLLFTIIVMLTSCTTVKVAKEVTKATNSIKTSVDKLINKKQARSEQEENKVQNIEAEIQILEKEKEKEKELVNSQKKIFKTNFMGKTLKEIKSKLGEENLNRYDGNTQMVRFDINSCKLFFFFNTSINNPRVEYYEIRDELGTLINTKVNIQNCYKNYNLS